MKKIILLIFLFTVLTVSAAPEASLTAKIEKSGTEYMAKIGISGNPGISSFKITVSYDGAAVIGCEKGELLTSGGIWQTNISDENFDKTQKKLDAVFIGTENITADGILFTVLFEGSPEIKVTAAESDVIDAGYNTVKLISAEAKYRKETTGGGGNYSKKEETAQIVTQPEEIKLPFKDVSLEHWFFDAVKYMSEKGYMNGINEDTFSPDGSISRAMLVTVLWRMENSPIATKNPFNDVQTGSWYEKAIDWAFESGVTAGVSETEFAPDSSISREQIATLIFRYAKLKGYNTDPVGICGYNDRSDISEYATEAVAWCGETGIMSGRGENLFAPKANATRAEMAAVIMRFSEKY